MQVRVHFNYHRKCWAVHRYHTGIGWRLWKNASRIFLHECTFKVSQAGRKRVLKEKRKNVHAFVFGEYIPAFKPAYKYWTKFSYNPYKNKEFITSTGDKLSCAKKVVFTQNKEAYCFKYN